MQEVRFMLKSLTNSLIRYFGYELHRVPFKSAFHAQQMLLCGNKALTIFDVGAHIGDTVAKYKSLFPESAIYCFEPLPESFEKFSKRFKGDSSVKPICMAVSDEVGKREFCVNRLSATNSLLPRPQSGRRYYPKNAETITKIEVPVTTIDGFCKEKSISEIHILKMDIQGGELMALQGATEKLNECLIALIYTEVMFVPHYEGGALFYEICNFLSDYGYILFDIFYAVRAKNGQLRYADAIFVSQQIRTDVLDSFDSEP